MASVKTDAFLDRDGTVIVEKVYLKDPNDVE
jgi:histidinol phosphatase-like enzyme